MPASGKVGHRKTWGGKEVIFLHGTGCRHFEDCLSCPFTDCFMEYHKLPKRAFKEK